MTRAAALAAAAGIAASLAFAAPASADPDNDAFLAALNRADIPYANNNADLTAQLGERVCPMLVEPGKNFAQVATTVADNGINPGLAAFFTGIAISMYCPQMMGSIGNGTFLNMLQDNQGLSGLAGVPRLPGLPVR
ncbi:DUF732 domain-containing protein [Mycobacterium sp. ITM-2016-00318]|uniref:DUF732 domain-containing protein n=1 Tax=Mycobacterium sp. ITM-2016-00318 TaxID=2099693 RepID=UPI0037C57B6C